MRSALPFSTGGRSLSSSHPEGSILSTPPAIFYVQMSPCFQNIRNVRSGARGKITIGSSIPPAAPFGQHILPSMVENYPNVMLSFVDGKSTDFERMICSAAWTLA